MQSEDVGTSHQCICILIPRPTFLFPVLCMVKTFVYFFSYGFLEMKKVVKLDLQKNSFVFGVMSKYWTLHKQNQSCIRNRHCSQQIMEPIKRLLLILALIKLADKIKFC